MTEHRPIPPQDVSPEGLSHTRKVPPLVWIILALLIGLGAYAGVSAVNHPKEATATSSTAP